MAAKREILRAELTPRAKTGLELLGEIPLVEEVRTGGDTGKPIVIQHPEHPVSLAFRTLATRVIEASQMSIH